MRSGPLQFADVPARRSGHRLAGRCASGLAALVAPVGSAALVVFVLLVLAADLPTARAADADFGERLYRTGVLPSGAPLQGERAGGASVAAAAAACVTCHRRSGLGGAEGRIVVPPIIGKYLFRPHATNVSDTRMPHIAGWRSTRDPYDAATLARAIREGVDPNGRELNLLMPRYALDDATMASLIAYLQRLTAAPAPGVGDDLLHFATIVTPDADGVAKDAMLLVMRRFFDDKNAFIRGGARPMQTSREIEYRVTRRWQLHVWELAGPPQTWEAQLDAKFAAEPVFAVISGLGGSTWAPVHRFCTRVSLPCLLPNVELPAGEERDFYPVYFSRGVLLEADLFAARLMPQRAVPSSGRVGRIVQVVRAGDVGAAAAAALSRSLTDAGIAQVLQRLPARADGGRGEGGADPAAKPRAAIVAGAAERSDARAGELASALAAVRPGDTLVLWLRGADLAALPTAVPPENVAVLLSGTMGGLEEAPLPPAWRARALMSYPFDLPDLRRVRMNFPLMWFRIRGIPVTAQRVQTDTYVACGIVSEALVEMLDSFVPDYLLERVESMLGHRLSNGYYPRLSLAAGQRYASKGGYLVRLGEERDTVMVDGDWVVPDTTEPPTPMGDAHQ